MIRKVDIKKKIVVGLSFAMIALVGCADQVDESVYNHEYAEETEEDDEAEVDESYTEEQSTETIVNNDKYHMGDKVIFGVYEQDNDYNNGPEPIEWYVIGSNKDYYILYSVYSIDYLPYNENYSNTTALKNEDAQNEWNDSTIRAWLNNSFLNGSFTEDQRENFSPFQHDGLRDFVFLLDFFTASDLPIEIKRTTCTDFCYEKTPYNPQGKRIENSNIACATRTTTGLNSIYLTNDGSDVDHALTGMVLNNYIRPAISVNRAYIDSLDQEEIATADTEIQVSDNILGVSFSEAAHDEDCHFYIESNNNYYPLSVGALKVTEYPDLMFGENNCFIQKINRGERIIGFTNMWSIKKVNDELIYSLPQGLNLYSDGTLRFLKGDFNTEYFPTCNIISIDGEDVSNFADYICLGDYSNDYYLNYKEPKEVEIKYYEDYEECCDTISVNQLLFIPGQEYDNAEEAPEGYYYFDTMGLEPGKYCVNTRGWTDYIFEVVE